MDPTALTVSMRWTSPFLFKALCSAWSLASSLLMVRSGQGGTPHQRLPRSSSEERRCYSSGTCVLRVGQLRMMAAHPSVLSLCSVKTSRHRQRHRTRHARHPPRPHHLHHLTRHLRPSLLTSLSRCKAGPLEHRASPTHGSEFQGLQAALGRVQGPLDPTHITGEAQPTLLRTFFWITTAPFVDPASPLSTSHITCTALKLGDSLSMPVANRSG